MKPIDISSQILAKSMSLRLQRHAVIAGNIANADTPGYRPSQLSFEQELQGSVQKGRAQDVQKITGRVEVADDGLPRLDGNTVNLDRQMSSLAENSIIYNATAEFLARKVKMLRHVIG